MNVEDRLKAALQGTAKLVEDRPRPLPAAPRRQGLPRFMPAWAALVVALVVLGPFVLPDGEPDAPIPMSSPSLAIGTAPEVYVAVYRSTRERKSRFEVRSTATGELLGVNHAGNGEEFVSIASIQEDRWEIPEDEERTRSSFYLLARLGVGTLPECARYTVYGAQISADGGFASWGGNAVTFEALDGTPANLTTTPRGDGIAYSYESCGGKAIVGGEEFHVGDGASAGERMIAHHWKGTTTTWGAGGRVLNLGYSPDGHSLAVFRQRDAEAGKTPRSELLYMRTAEPSDTISLLDGSDDTVIRASGPSSLLANAMISPDGKKIVAVFSEQGSSGTELSVTEFPVGGGSPRAVGPLEPTVDQPADASVLLKQHPSGPELLLQAGNTTLFLSGDIKALVPSLEETASDVAW